MPAPTAALAARKFATIIDAQRSTEAGARGKACALRVDLKGLKMHGLSELPSKGTPLADLIGAVRHRVALAGRIAATRQRANAGRRRPPPARANVRTTAGLRSSGPAPAIQGFLPQGAASACGTPTSSSTTSSCPTRCWRCAAPRAELIDVGKKGYGRSCKQGDINDLMVALAAAGRCVVRLKAGDPLMFGRLEEEMAALDASGIRLRDRARHLGSAGQPRHG